MNHNQNWRHLELGDVSSTNDICFEKARAGEEGGLWITGARQLKGRGRRGRSWVSETGNLYASLMLINPAAPDMTGSLPLAAAVAVNRAINRVMAEGVNEAEIKWPNDILIDHKKVSGMLLETEELQRQCRCVVIGCGVNVAHHPGEGLYPTTSLHEQGIPISPVQLFSHLFDEMSDIIGLWDEGRGIATIRKLWLESAAGIGENINVNLPNASISGQFVGLADNGNLILRLENGDQMSIAAGDVFMPSNRKE